MLLEAEGPLEGVLEEKLPMEWDGQSCIYLEENETLNGTLTENQVRKSHLRG